LFVIFFILSPNFWKKFHIRCLSEIWHNPYSHDNKAIYLISRLFSWELHPSLDKGRALNNRQFNNRSNHMWSCEDFRLVIIEIINYCTKIIKPGIPLMQQVQTVDNWHQIPQNYKLCQNVTNFSHKTWQSSTKYSFLIWGPNFAPKIYSINRWVDTVAYMIEYGHKQLFSIYIYSVCVPRA